MARGFEVDFVRWVDDSIFFDPGRGREIIPFPARIRQEVCIGNYCGFRWLWYAMKSLLDVGGCDNDETVDMTISRCQCWRALDAMLDAITCEPRSCFNESDGRNVMYGWFASNWVAATDDPDMQESFCPSLRNMLLPLAEIPTSSNSRIVRR